MPTTKSDVQIYYETRGSRDGVPLLLIQGFTWQMIGWREGFCQSLVDRGAYVIIYDHRDVGLSQKFGGVQDFDGGYDLGDMAADGFRVLDDLGLEAAHLAGASMGGMIAQTMALAQPKRVLSLNLIYTTPNLEPHYFPGEQPDLEAMPKHLERAQAINAFVATERVSRSSSYRYDKAWIRELGERMFDRCYAPEGNLRQLLAMIRWGQAPESLRALNMPSSIVHGRADNRINVQAAFDLANYLKTSEVHIYPGLGHEIPEALWGEFAGLIMKTAARAE